MPPRTIQLASDRDFHRRSWRVQRISFALLGAVVIAALLGSFGDGPLSRASSTDGRGLSVEYERFARAEARTTVDVRYAPRRPDAPAASGARELVIGRAWIDQMRHITFTPPPREIQAENAAIRYRFALPSADALHVRIEAEPIGPGRVQLRLAQAGSAPIGGTQLVFP